tara:strand:- start:5937 stop:6134 length:198 start_codon:yes stop_codon:yes gene_type:complete
MRFGNKKTVHLTIFEMKEALMDYFIKRGFEELAEHLNNNSWNLDLLVRQKYWLLSMEGETSVEDE